MLWAIPVLALSTQLEQGRSIPIAHMGPQAMIAGDDIHGSILGGSDGGLCKALAVLRPLQMVFLPWGGAIVAGGKEKYVQQKGSVERHWYGVGCPMGLCYIGPPASMMFYTVSGLVWIQASDWLSSTVNGNTGVNRMRAARVVASLWQVVTLWAHSSWASRWLDPKAEDGGDHDDDDGGVPMTREK